jgi:hypothetical protein
MLLVAMSATASARDTTSGLTFRDTRPIVVTLDDIAAGVPGNRLKVCNAGTRVAKRLRLTRTGFGFTHNGVPLSDGAILRHARLVRSVNGRDLVAHQLTSGNCAEIAVDVRFHAELDTGNYTGEVVVSSVGGGLARRSVTITGPPDLTVPAEGVADTTEIKVVHKSGPFHFLVADHGKRATVPLLAPPRGKQLDIPATCGEGAAKPSALCPGIGAVLHRNTSAEVVLGGHPPDAVGGVVRLPVRLIGAHDVGDYQGAIHPSGDVGDGHPIKTVVQVTDAWWWALIALLFGVGLVMGPQLWMRRYKPKSVLMDRAGALLGEYSRAKLAFRGERQPANFPDIDPPEGGDVAVYAEDVRAATRTLVKSTVFVDRGSDSYKQVDLSLDIAERDIEGWRDPDELLRALTALKDELDSVQGWLRARRFVKESPAATRKAADVLARRRLKIGEVRKVVADADVTTVLLHDWCALAQRVMRLQLWWRKIAVALLAEEAGQATGADPRPGPSTAPAIVAHADLGRRLARLKRELREARDSATLRELRDRPALAEIEAALEVDGGRLELPVPADDASHENMSGRWEPFQLTPELRRELSMGSADDLGGEDPQPLTADELVGKATPFARKPARSVSLDRSWRWLGDVLAIALAIVVALITAMAVIVSDKNFGSAKDYLTVIFIGTAAQAAATAIIPVINSALVDRFGTTVVTKAAPARAAGASPADAGDA